MSDIHELLDAADQILASQERTAPRWLRAASLLYRCALEEAMSEYWKVSAPGVHAANGRAKLACLTHYEPDIAREASAAWGALSEMTHHYSDLGPRRQAVLAQGKAAKRVVEALDERRARISARRE